jgi:EAL domain-containing protein (putative c-di-GMP-specific phosphodiesterase class I)
MQALGLDYVEINLSVAQCLQQDLPAIVARLQARYGVQPSQVNFEITETMFDNLSEVMDRNRQELVRMGYSFSLDDYGIGYSNIHRLSKLPLEIIKIDKSLVDEMFTEDGQVIIRNTVRMMQDIRKELVIEGVETREEMEALAAMSCDFIQGYYYSRPLPTDEFVRFLQTHNRAA